eukprot:TRINITY_DN49435_c0_g1_i1.p1 TRINITY_DN49435_c0_g1~~TRINITY_DN49435_c0_g1_i1.p1  ORF type:complete len:509 (+),score=82.56 TRINITY_DN49435_c0_g1_i1:53-1579(+)
MCDTGHAVDRCSQGVAVTDECSRPWTVSAWRDHWRQLCLCSFSAETDCQREMQSARLLGQNQADELASEIERNENERNVWQTELWSSLACVRGSIGAFATEVRAAKSGDRIQAMVQSVEKELSVFGSTQREQYEELATLQHTLEESLSVVSSRFDAWCTQTSALHRTWARPASRERPPSCIRGRLSPQIGFGDAGSELANLKRQVDQLDSEIYVAGGATGGWPTEDHDTFFRVFNKFRRQGNGAEFLAEVQSALPIRRHEELVAHATWLTAHERRQATKRGLLQKWRKLRAVTTPENDSEGSQQVSFVTDAVDNDRSRQEQRTQERRHREQAKRREEVAAWQQARKLKQAKKVAEQLDKQTESAERRSQHERRLELSRPAVQAFKEKRVAELEQMRLARSSSAPSLSVSRESKQRVAERSATLCQRKVEQLQAARCRKAPPSFTPPSRKVAYENIESRLHVHTETYVEKRRELREDDDASDVQARNFAHQGVLRTVRSSPSWRPNFGV